MAGDIGPADAELVARTRTGDREAFGLLVRRYLRAARAVALCTVPDPADADDVCQEAFLDALTHIEDCRDPARFVGWLLTIVRNRGFNRGRYLRRRTTEPLDHELQARDDPARELDRSLLRDRLRAALGQLTETQQQVIVLADLEGWSHREISQMLGISEGSSRLTLFRARRGLKGLLGEDQLADLTPTPE